jgi:transposase-like protein
MEDAERAQSRSRVASEADAYEFLEGLRWDGQVTCPHCRSVSEHYFLRPANGSARKTRTGSASERRVWKCAACRRQFSVLTATALHSSKVRVATWINLVFEMCAGMAYDSSQEVCRKHGVNPRTARRILELLWWTALKQPPHHAKIGPLYFGASWWVLSIALRELTAQAVLEDMLSTKLATSAQGDHGSKSDVWRHEDALAARSQPLEWH